MNYKNKTVLMIDNGVFTSWAELLGRYFGRVLLWIPWINAFPKSNTTLIGYGLRNVTRVMEFWSLLDEIDLVFCPDVMHGPLQNHLEKLGKPVWGSRSAENLELDRDGSKQLCMKLGIPIGPYEVVVGLDALREYLKEHDDQWVKVSLTRGDFESFPSKNYAIIEPRLDELEHTLGAKKKVIKFIVEEAIDPAVEVGTDGWTIDGEFPEGSLWGVELKDRGYLSKVCQYNELPKELRSVNEKLSKVFEVCHYRGFWSTECRITPDRTPYLIDPTTRAGSPPSELMQLLITNWPDIIWNGAHGDLVEPAFAAKWGAELLLHSSFADKNWLSVEFPDSIADSVKLRNCCRIDGKLYVSPQWVGLPECGAVVAMGDSKKEAIEKCKEVAGKVEGFYIETYRDSFDEAQRRIDQLAGYGIKFD